MEPKNIYRLALLSTAAIFMSGCVMGTNLSPAEQEVKTDLTPSKYQPATREARNNISTQDNFAQAAFWSREYQLNPSDLEAAIRLSSAVRKMGNPGKAVEIAQTSRAMHPKDPYLTAEYAAALIASERGEEAIEALDGGLGVAPGYARLWSLKGAALDQLEQYDSAKQHYARALQITPNDPNIMSNLGLSYALAGDAATAETWLRRAAGQPGASVSIQQTLDMIMQLQGKAPQQAQAQPQAPVRQQAAPQSRAAPSSHAQTYEGYGRTQSAYQQPQHRSQGFAAQQSPQNIAPRTTQRLPYGTYEPRTYGNAQGQPFRPTPSSAAQTQQQTYQPQAYAPQSFKPQAPAQSSQAGTSFTPPAPNTPQVQHRSNFTFTGSQPGGPQSAADAARAAAAQSTGQNRRVVVPADAPVTNQLQTDILSQIARNVGPQRSEEPVQLRRRFAPPQQQQQPQYYPQGKSQAQSGYPQQGYPAYPTQGQAAEQNEGNVAARGAARRR